MKSPQKDSSSWVVFAPASCSRVKTVGDVGRHMNGPFSSSAAQLLTAAEPFMPVPDLSFPVTSTVCHRLDDPLLKALRSLSSPALLCLCLLSALKNQISCSQNCFSITSIELYFLFIHQSLSIFPCFSSTHPLLLKNFNLVSNWPNLILFYPSVALDFSL